MSVALPPVDLVQQQADWLAPARARLLRRVAVAHRRSVLDLGAGYGIVTAELARRSPGRVIACDRALEALQAHPPPPHPPPTPPVDRGGQGGAAHRVCSDVRCLPFAAATFDLVFCQCVLLWVVDPPRAVAEVRRVLQPGGVFVALEPDYGGMIEHPPAIATRDLWLAALKRAGAQPFIGRMLPALLATQGFTVRVDLIPEIHPPAHARFNVLRGLPLTHQERTRLARIERHDATLSADWSRIAHLPFFLITASIPDGHRSVRAFERSSVQAFKRSGASYREIK